jgi:hypothetical protein
VNAVLLQPPPELKKLMVRLPGLKLALQVPLVPELATIGESRAVNDGARSLK